MCAPLCTRNAGASSPRPVTRALRSFVATCPRVGPARSRPAGPRSARRLPPRLNRRRAGGSARRGGRDRRPRLARPSARSGGPHGPPLGETAGSPRSFGAASPRAKDTRPGPRRVAALRLNACTDGAAFVPARAGFHSAAPTVPASALRRPARKPTPFAALTARRVLRLALRLAPCVPRLRRGTAAASRRSPGSPLRRALPPARTGRQPGAER